MRALYWAAVLNGLLAPALLVGILIVASDRRLMLGQSSSRLGLGTVAVAATLMAIGAVAMFVA